MMATAHGHTQHLKRWSMALALAAAVPAHSANAQVRAPARPSADSITTRQAAESLAVLNSLLAHVQNAPTDAVAHFHIAQLAQLLCNREWWLKLPRDYTRNKERNEHGQLVPLLSLAADSYHRAIELDGQNTEYLIAAGWFVCGGATSTVANPTCAKGLIKSVGFGAAAVYFDRARAIFRVHPDPPRHAALEVGLGRFRWSAYEGEQLWVRTPIAGFAGSVLPDGVRIAGTDTAAREPPNITQVSSARAGATGAGTGGVGGAGVLATRGEPGRAGTTAGTAADGSPMLGRLGGMAAPRVVVAPMSVAEAAGRTLGGALPRVLAVASRNAIESVGVPPGQFFGEWQYLAAGAFWDEAHRVLPSDERVWRSVALHRAARSNWAALKVFAEERTRLAPADPWGWMALGLARQRLREGASARAALDSGLALMTPAERAHLDRLDRVMRPSDSIRYVRGDSTFRANAAGASWLLARPLWSVESENPRTEFLARIAYAEVRWGSLSPREYGADTPSGRLYVRYGPPVAEYNTYWLYGGGLIFAPRSSLAGDLPITRRTLEWQPARWDNIAETRIDSMPVQAARFRARGDSVDFYLAARAPIESLVKVATINTAPFVRLWFTGREAASGFNDSVAVPPAGVLEWRRRMAVGPYYYRVEAIVPGTLAAGRAASQVLLGADSATGFAMRGFGMSDLLVATRSDASTAARRWSDISFVPLTGDISRAGSAAVIWENYDVGVRDGTAKYRVTISLQRELAAPSRVDFEVEGVGAPVRSRRGESAFTVEFDRSVPFAPTLVDNIALSFGTTPPGGYELTVTVRDGVTGRMTSRSTRIVLAK